MHEQDVLRRGVGPEWRRLGVEAGRANDGEFAVSTHPLVIEQPCSSRRGQTFLNAIERRLAPVIVVPRHAIHRRLDPSEDVQGFRQMPGFLNQVAREADKVRGQGIDAPHHRLQIGTVALVMDVGEVDEPVGRFATPKRSRRVLTHFGFSTHRASATANSGAASNAANRNRRRLNMRALTSRFPILGTLSTYWPGGGSRRRRR